MDYLYWPLLTKIRELCNIAKIYFDLFYNYEMYTKIDKYFYIFFLVFRYLLKNIIIQVS